MGILGYYLPKEEVPNDVVTTEAGVDASWVERKIGFVARWPAAPEQAASDLAVQVGGEAPASPASVRAPT